MTTCAALSRPLAFCRSRRSTTAGTTATEALSKRGSEAPIKKNTAYSRGTPARSSRTATPRRPISAERKRSTYPISNRRSSRSMRAPACSENSSHASCLTKTAPAIRRGSRVTLATSSGAAASVTPSPRLEIVLAVQSFPYSGPRPIAAPPSPPTGYDT